MGKRKMYLLCIKETSNLDLIGIYLQMGVLCTAIISAIVALISYLRSRKKQRIERAMELAEYYRTEILEKFSFFTSVIQTCDYGKKVLKYLEDQSIEKFSCDEMEEIIKKEIDRGKFENVEAFIKDLNDSLISVSYEELMKAKTISLSEISTIQEFKLLSDVETHKDGKQQDSSDSKKSQSKEFAKVLLQKEFECQIITILNSLEWFAMNFTTKLADCDSVYQSLHQTYLLTVRYLYFFISGKNKSFSEKYYTHLIELYNMWKEKNNKQREKERKLKEKYRKRDEKNRKREERHRKRGERKITPHHPSLK